MALIASPGLGKTTILLRLMERLRKSARTAFLFQMHTNSQEFLRNLITDLDIEPSGHDLGELQRQLGDILIQEAKSGRRIVVAIDEAQNLDIGVLETVRMLSNFETTQAKLLQIVLVGQPQLADKLGRITCIQLSQPFAV
jgi:general secretion pathway protein A